MRNCPICDDQNYKILFEKNVEDFDQNKSFRFIRIVLCDKCGFVFNNNVSIYEVDRFYVNENYYSQQQTTGSGTSDSYSLTRYEHYYDIFSTYLTKDSLICDVGCGKGGFVEFMKEKGFSRCYGLEIQPELVSKSQLSYIKIGSIEDIPLVEDEKFDCLVIANLFEHIFSFGNIISSIEKSLKNEGFLFIDVPDASNYMLTRREPYIWYLGTKEHIEHFSIYHLYLLINSKTQYSFNLLKTENKIDQFNSQGHTAPLLMALFQLNKRSAAIFNGGSKDSLANAQIKYLNKSAYILDKANSIINEYVKPQKPIICWGIGYTFFTYASMTNLLDCNILKFVDKNKKKQTLTFHGRSIDAPETINNKMLYYDIFIFSNQFEAEIRDYLQRLGHKGNLIVL